MLRLKPLALARIAACVVISSCGGDEYVDHSVRVIIPADIETIQQGTLRLELWSYEQGLADAPARLIDDNVVVFSHRRGSTTQREMFVSGHIGGGRHRHYITVRGFERVDGRDVYILWDGIRGTQTPRVVVMEYAVFPADGPIAAR